MAPGRDPVLQPIFEFLTEAVRTPGLSGHEGRVASVLERHWRPLCDEVRTDRLGSVIALRRGEGAPLPLGGEQRRGKVMLAAHIDEIGLIVIRIEEGGFLRVSSLGGADPSNLQGQEVLVHTEGGDLPGVVGTKPPHLTSPEERRKVPKVEDLFVDVGLPEEAVRQRVRVGDPISVRREPEELAGNRVASKALDNRASVAVLYQALRHLQRLRHQVDVYAVGTVQEEVGLRGAVTSAFGVAPDLAVAVDVTHARQPGVPEHQASVALGKGPALAQGPNIHPAVLQSLETVARDAGIAFQKEYEPAATGTDAWAIQVTKSGVPTGLVSVPLRYMHGPGEVVSLEDISAAGRLLAEWISRIDGQFLQSLATEVIPGGR